MSTVTPVKRSPSPGSDDGSPPNKRDKPASNDLLPNEGKNIQELQLAGGEINPNQSRDVLLNLLGSFDQLLEDMPINIGMFEVMSCTHIAFGEKSNLSEPVTNIVLMDSQKRKSVFTAFGDHATNWKILEVGQVVQLENFEWRKDYKQQSRFYGITSTHCGKLTEESSFIVNTELSKLFAEYRAHQIDHVTSFGEINEDCERVVLFFDFKYKKEKIRCKDGVRRDKLDCFFLTSDRIHVVLTAFANNCTILESLEQKQMFVIENLNHHEDVAHPSDHLQFTVTAKTKFIRTALALKTLDAQKISLMEINAGAFVKTTVYEIDGYVRQNSAKCTGKDYSQTVIFDNSSESKTAFAAVIRYVDAVVLQHGQKIKFKFHVEEAHTKKMLNVVPGSIVIENGEIYPVDQIAKMQFNVI